MKKKVLEINDVTIGFVNGREKSVVSSNINLALYAGEFVCLLGTNGAGKTTLLRALTHLQPPLYGDVLLEGDSLYSLTLIECAKKIAMVMTERPQVGGLSVYDLVSLGRYPHTDYLGRLTTKDHEAIVGSLKSVGALHLKDRLANEISDGELQKVMIARALAQEPSILILDEPTNFLDISNRIDMLILLQSLALQTGKAVLMSTHDFELALKTADKIWLMSKEGGVVSGLPEELVLNGQFNTLFKSEDSEFDIQTGTLKIHKRSKGHVGLMGEGLPVFWTSKALERRGYDVYPNQLQKILNIDVVYKDKKYFWDLNLRGHKRVCSSIESLLEVMEHPESMDS